MMMMNNNSSTTRLAPLTEEPIVNEEEEDHYVLKNSTTTNSSSKKLAQTWRLRKWIKTLLLFNKKSHLNILLSVLACPLFPVPLLPKLSPSISQVPTYIFSMVFFFVFATGCPD